MVRGLWREWRPACLDQTHARKAPGSADFWCNLVDEQIGTISYVRIVAAKQDLHPEAVTATIWVVYRTVGSIWEAA